MNLSNFFSFLSDWCETWYIESTGILDDIDEENKEYAAIELVETSLIEKSLEIVERMAKKLYADTNSNDTVAEINKLKKCLTEMIDA